MRPTLALLCAILAGCDALQPAPPALDPVLAEAQRQNAKNPIGRFVVAGTREYPNGTEIYVLDTKSGQVCYYFVASGTGNATAQKTDMQSCAGPALAPSY